MRTLFVIAGAVAALLPAAAVAEPLDDPVRAQAAWLQAEQQRRMERAAEQCNLHRGTDCVTPQGLQEWLLNDRSRAEAVLDRIAPITVVPQLQGGSASAGGSLPPNLAR
jgi:hypothetical protein